MVNEFKVGYNAPQTSALAFGATPATIRSASRCPAPFTSSSIDARGNTGIARSGLLIRAIERLVDHRLDLRPALAVVQRRADLDARRAHAEDRAASTATSSRRLPVPRQHRDHLQQRQRLHRQPAGRGAGRARLAGLHAAAVLPDRLRAGLVARERQADAGAGPALRLLLGGQGSRGPREAVLRRGQRVRHRPGQLLRPGQEQLLAAAVGGVSAQRQDGGARRLRPVLRPGPVRGPHPADRELHRAPARRRRPTCRTTAWRIRSPASTSATCCRFAATRTTARTSTTCSTAPACRASCPARST